MPFIDANGNQTVIVSFYSQDSFLGKIYKYIFKSPFTHVTFTCGDITLSHGLGIPLLSDTEEYWDVFDPVCDIVIYNSLDKIEYKEMPWSCTFNCMHAIKGILEQYGLYISESNNLKRFFRQLICELRRSGLSFRYVKRAW